MDLKWYFFGIFSDFYRSGAAPEGLGPEKGGPGVPQGLPEGSLKPSKVQFKTALVPLGVARGAWG